MNSKFLFLLLLVSSISLSGFAEIRELHSLHEIVKDVRPGDWVAFDIDMTLLTQAQSYGGDAWFVDNISRLQKSEGIPQQKAFQATAAEFRVVNEKTRVIPSEPGLAELIKSLQARGVVVFAFTARNSGLRDISIRQITDLGVDFSRSAPLLKVDGENVEHAVMKNGVLFSNHKTKGETLEALIRSTTEKPTRFLMIDDKRKNLATIEKAAHKIGIDYVGTRYGALDHVSASYNSDVALVERIHFAKTGELLSDNQALPLVKRGYLCEQIFN